MAAAVLHGLRNRFAVYRAMEVDSAGTEDWNVGDPADPRAVRVAAQYGYDLLHHRARVLGVNDFLRFDWLLAMDAENLAVIESMKPHDSLVRVARLLDFSVGLDTYDIPDPYYGEESGFHDTVALIEKGCYAFLASISSASPLPPQRGGNV